MKEFKNFGEFYLFYLREHQNANCRKFHFMGTSLVLLTLIYMIITRDWRWWFMLPIFGYGFSWIGHFRYERNKPAAFKYPFYSLLSDFVMYGQTWTGKLSENLKKAVS